LYSFSFDLKLTKLEVESSPDYSYTPLNELTSLPDKSEVNVYGCTTRFLLSHIYFYYIYTIKGVVCFIKGKPETSKSKGSPTFFRLRGNAE
jgi:hypothetical protein